MNTEQKFENLSLALINLTNVLFTILHLQEIPSFTDQAYIKTLARRVETLYLDINEFILNFDDLTTTQLSILGIFQRTVPFSLQTILNPIL